MTGRGWLIIGAAMGFVSVAAGAFGAHGLRARVEPAMLEVWEVAARYEMYHALAMILLGMIMEWREANGTVKNESETAEKGQSGDWRSQGGIHKALPLAGWLFLAGIVIFSGSLYLLTLTGLRWLGAITPIGGIAFLAGWVCLAIGAAHKPPKSPVQN